MGLLLTKKNNCRDGFYNYFSLIKNKNQLSCPHADMVRVIHIFIAQNWEVIYVEYIIKLIDVIIKITFSMNLGLQSLCTTKKKNLMKWESLIPMTLHFLEK